MPGALATAYASGSTSQRDRYEQIRASLWTTRSSFDAHWKDLADFLIPRRIRLTPSDVNRGDKRNQNIIDSTARLAIRTLASGMHAGLTSPARPWMKLTTPDPDLATHEPVKEWLHEVTQRMLAVFLESNLYNVLPILYADMGVFGTAAMSVLDDTKDLFRCYSYPIGSFALGLNERNVVSTFVHEYQRTVRQVVEQFGVRRGYRDVDWSSISDRVKQQWLRGEYEASVDLVWIVLPNDDADERRIGARYLPFVSCHYEKSEVGKPGGGFLRHSGFHQFPIMAPRWDVTGEDTYGTDCPGMTVLGDVRQLQTQQKKKGQAIAKMIDPPLVGPSALKTQKTSLIPGDVTYVDVRDGMQGLKAIHEINLNLEHLRMDMSEVQDRIRRGFYEDLFLMMASTDAMRGSQPVTAREIDERHEEKLLALGPVLERTNDELLDPIVDRVYNMMERAGLIPLPPQELHGVALKVEYTSIMAQAQKLVGVVGLDRFMASMGQVAQFLPDVLDKVDEDQVADSYGDMLDVDPRIVRTSDEAQQRRTARQQSQQAQIAAQQAESLGKAAGAAGARPIAQDSPLDRVLSSVSGAPVVP